jgi:hypothetical protein
MRAIVQLQWADRWATLTVQHVLAFFGSIMPRQTLKHLIFTTAAIPIGAASGFICAGLLVSACRLWGWLYSRGSESMDFKFLPNYVLLVAANIGVVSGAVGLPLGYLLFLRHINDGQVIRILGWLFTGVLLTGLLVSPFLEAVTLIAVYAGFLGALSYARRKTQAC